MWRKISQPPGVATRLARRSGHQAPKPLRAPSPPEISSMTQLLFGFEGDSGGLERQFRGPRSNLGVILLTPSTEKKRRAPACLVSVRRPWNPIELNANSVGI